MKLAVAVELRRFRRNERLHAYLLESILHVIRPFSESAALISRLKRSMLAKNALDFTSAKPRPSSPSNQQLIARLDAEHLAGTFRDDHLPALTDAHRAEEDVLAARRRGLAELGRFVARQGIKRDAASTSASALPFAKWGTLSPASHFATVCRDTPTRCANASCVSPFARRSV